MSKLYTKYLECKKKNSNFVYLFKVGIFYLALEEDAKKLSEALKLKLGNLNENIAKVGFPVSRLDHYIRLLQALNIPFKIADETYGMVDNYSDYLNNQKIKEILTEILQLDFNNITFKESFEILLGIQKRLQNIYDDGGTNNDY